MSEKDVLNPKGEKYVLNPVASVSRCFKEQSPEKPQYETDKIIIPSKAKNKAQVDNRNENAVKTNTEKAQSSNVVPSFSTKNYNLKTGDNIRGILGVEYVIKILKSASDNSPRYECGLCELVLDSFAMQCHLEGYNHRLKFCEKHFPTAIRHYRQYIHGLNDRDSVKVMTRVLSKLAIAIEKYHGRNLPYECYERDFSLNRHQILAKAFSCRHASEQYGPSFTHVVESKEIDAFRDDRYIDDSAPLPPDEVFDSKCEKINFPSQKRRENRDRQPSSSNPTRSNNVDSMVMDNAPHTNERHNRRSEEKLGKRNDQRHIQKHSPNRQDCINRNENSRKLDKYNRPKTDIESSWNRQSNYTVSRSSVNAHTTENEKTYDQMVDDFLRETNASLQRDRPRGKKRFSETTHTNSSPKRRNTSPKNTDILQVYDDIVDKQVSLLTEKFADYKRDPESYPSYSDEWKQFWKRRKNELIVAGVDHRTYNYQPEWKFFIKERMDELFTMEVEKIKQKTRDLLGFPQPNNDVNNQTQNCDDKTIPNHTTESAPSTAVCRPEQVVSVLRMMTAFEEHLGNVGPNITALLSHCLQIAKSDGESLADKILNERNKTLIKIAADNLKTLVREGVIASSKERTIQTIVDEAIALLSSSLS
uniref:Uncharacterized protein n=1 Tax=Stomoxys calcitrans TaxID=35570 RepID=A0A1I8PLN3_STOCA